jgi:hypothetical protein
MGQDSFLYYGSMLDAFCYGSNHTLILWGILYAFIIIKIHVVYYKACHMLYYAPKLHAYIIEHVQFW